MSPLRLDTQTNQLELTGFALTCTRKLGEFAGFVGEATFLWPRWIFLRLLGLILLLFFLNLTVEGTTLIGVQGLDPLGEYLLKVKSYFGDFSGPVAHPTLFWISSADTMIRAVSWLGLLAAAAVILNLWPRLALGVCFVSALSFVVALRGLAAFEHDDLLLETTFLALFHAPGGLRPRLGNHSPPRPIATLALRCLLFRLMFESGLSKFLSGDVHWLNFTAMDIHYEVSPNPTFFGYLAHQLPHWYHVCEIFLMILAEILAPLLMLCGRRPRLAAFVIWTAFQCGIALTGNFAFLNFNALALGVLLLDDQALGRPFLPQAVLAPIRGGLRRFFYYAPLAYNFAFSALLILFMAEVPYRSLTPHPNDSLLYQLRAYRFTNHYHLYFRFTNELRYQIEFEGSNDGGKTWRNYEPRFLSNRLDRISGFISPYFPRFEGSVAAIASSGNPALLFTQIMTKLLGVNRDVLALFKEDPFPDRPPTKIKALKWAYQFTDYETFRKTGNYWSRRALGLYQPPLTLNPATGAISEELPLPAGLFN